MAHACSAATAAPVSCALPSSDAVWPTISQKRAPSASWTKYARQAMPKPPCVFIIGAGPGDPGLITVRGLRHLEAADVVVYDHQVHPRLLRSARADAEKIDV